MNYTLHQPFGGALEKRKKLGGNFAVSAVWRNFTG